MPNHNVDQRNSNEAFYKALRILIHVIGAIQFSYSVYYDWNYVKIPKNVSRMGTGFGGKLKFLTFWDAILQAVYFTICLVNDMFGTNEINPKDAPLIRKVRDFMLSAIAFPLAMFVGLTFWALMAVDRELVFPKAIDPYFPGWLNHIMHTNIMVFTIIEVITSYRKYPSRNRGLTGLTVFMCIYLIWVHIIYSVSGEWVYPVLEVLNIGQRIIFFVALLLLGNALYLAGEFLNNAAWAKIETSAEQGGEVQEGVPIQNQTTTSKVVTLPQETEDHTKSM